MFYGCGGRSNFDWSLIIKFLDRRIGSIPVIATSILGIVASFQVINCYFIETVSTMAVISEYDEEEEQVQPRTSTSRQTKPSELVKPSKEIPAAAAPSQAQPRGQFPPPSQPDNIELHQHDPVLSAMLEEHKRHPLQLLTTVIDFLFRKTDLSRESRVESMVTEIVTAAIKRCAHEGEGVSPEKVAKVDQTKISIPEHDSHKSEPMDECRTPVNTSVGKTSAQHLQVKEPQGDEVAEGSEIAPSPPGKVEPVAAIDERPASKDVKVDEPIEDQGTGLSEKNLSPHFFLVGRVRV